MKQCFIVSCIPGSMAERHSKVRSAGLAKRSRGLHGGLGCFWRRPSGSADFQSAVSPISNRLTVRLSEAACFGDARQNRILRYGRLEICAASETDRKSVVWDRV